MHTRRRAIFATAAFFAGLCLPMMAQSQATYPNRAIKLVVPYSAGGLPATIVVKDRRRGR